MLRVSATSPEDICVAVDATGKIFSLFLSEILCLPLSHHCRIDNTDLLVL